MGSNGNNRTGLFKIIERVGNTLERLIEIPVFILSIIMTMTVLLGVFSRYVIRSPLGWTEEFSRYVMIWMALLSVALCIWRHEHVGVTMVIKKFPRKIAKILIFISNGFVFYFLYILAKYGFKMAEGGKVQLSTALNTSMKWWLMAVPASAVICMVMLLCKMILDVRRENLDEILMSEEVVDTVRREEGLDF
ncbi:MAG: TRAP transporter small permease [Aminobacterium sp.]|jgi:TRAP-type C4-dicarboxylate transport system permease small subunit|nr:MULTISPECIES: TRAP transporter small permease [unclassified Aminobacterium]MDD2206658.1 TRAP transporter small permease [Aminobacterium sp.]MDD3425536.1 TRAP transporter small permease [Aminobacterium sp.]MDD3706778.1 TRAP transporter small permease [Aminobacterium sp.]MDD4228595.1 TRAP transporter small permease [Aminobacterium sp.]MDD4551523.1 TRAP transporter small permease [Aminobacterium sp.]